jgi:hypothetical protein
MSNKNDYLEENTSYIDKSGERVEIQPKQELLKHLRPKKSSARKPNQQEREKLAQLSAEIKKSLEGKPRFYESNKEKLSALLEMAETRLLNKQIMNDDRDKKLLSILKAIAEDIRANKCDE